MEKCKAYLCEENAFALYNGRYYCMRHIKQIIKSQRLGSSDNINELPKS